MTLIEALCSLWKYVPGDVFMHILREKHLAVIAPAKVLQALAKQKEPLPGNLLLQTLRAYTQKSDFADAAFAYLGAFDQLPPLPEAELLVALTPLALHCSRQAIEGVRHLLSVSPLLHLLGHAETGVRAGALVLLQCFPGQVPLEPVLSLLDITDIGTRIGAVACLTALTRPFPAEIFTRVLSDPDKTMRCRLLESLDLDKLPLDATTPLDLLIAALSDPDRWNRLWALEALGKPEIIERVPVEIFIQAIATRYAYPDQQTSALETLRRKDPMCAVDQCLLALNHSDRTVCQTALQILQELHPVIIPSIVQEAILILEGGEPGRFFTAHHQRFFAEMAGYAGYAGHASPQIIARLGELLTWPYWEVRAEAAWALGRIRRNIPVSLIQLLQESCHDSQAPAVAEAARWALAQLQSSSI